MSVNLDTFMDTVTDDVQKPKPLPEGKYAAIVRSYEPGETGKGTPYVRLHLSVVDAETAEATPEEIKNAGDLRFDVWATEKSRWHVLKMFKEVFGFETEGRLFRELFEETVGERVIVDVHHVLGGEEKDEPYAQIKKLLAA